MSPILLYTSRSIENEDCYSWWTGNNVPDIVIVNVTMHLE
jgi:hypothetical protein